jgi:lysophospholipase L1-like esterase
MSKRAVGWTILLASIVIGLGVLELSTRVVFDRNGMHYGIEMWKYAKQLKRQSTVRDMGHEHVPDRTALLMGARVEISSLGLRNPEVALQKPEGFYRILVLGDSMTFGWGVQAEETYPRILERTLNAQTRLSDASRRFEVINAGVGNYNTAQEVSYFKERGVLLDPDMVILGFYVNDAETTPRAKSGWIRQRSYLYVLASSFWDAIWRRSGEAQGFEEYYLDLYQGDSPGWQAGRHALGELIALCRTRGIDLRVLLIPELHSPADHYPFESVHEQVRRIAEDAGIPTIEVRERMAGIEPHTLWVSPGDAHPNELAHRLVAAGLYESLRAELTTPLVDSSPTINTRTR